MERATKEVAAPAPQPVAFKSSTKWGFGKKDGAKDAPLAPPQQQPPRTPRMTVEVADLEGTM